jgi:hypothetical protein
MYRGYRMEGKAGRWANGNCASSLQDEIMTRRTGW